MLYISDKVALGVAAAVVLSVLINPLEQRIFPLSPEEARKLTTAQEIVAVQEELDSLRDELAIADSDFLGAFWDLQTKKRTLVEEYQFTEPVYGDGYTSRSKISDADIEKAKLVIEKYKSAVMILTQNNGNWGGIGTAFRISPDLVLTNAHNIAATDGSPPASLKFSLEDINGKEYPAEFIGADGAADIALLRLSEPNEELAYFNMADWTSSYRKDEVIVSVGHPALLGYWTPSIGRTTMGPFLSSQDTGNSAYIAHAQLNITSGASGSPIFDLDGNLEGILFATGLNSFDASSKNGDSAKSYLEVETLTFYSLAYDFKKKVSEWTR